MYATKYFCEKRLIKFKKYNNNKIGSNSSIVTSDPTFENNILPFNNT